jgi:hypothetical protein
MDDIVLLALGRQFLELSVRLEHLIRAQQAAAQELATAQAALTEAKAAAPAPQAPSKKATK